MDTRVADPDERDLDPDLILKKNRIRPLKIDPERNRSNKVNPYFFPKIKY